MKYMLTPMEVWEREDKKGKITIVCIGIAMLIATASLLVGGSNEEIAAETQVQTQPMTNGQDPNLPKIKYQNQSIDVASDKRYGVAKPKAHGYDYIVVKSGNCYTVGTNDDTGWIVNECMTRARATQKAAGMMAQRTEEIDFSNKTWEVVE